MKVSVFLWKNVGLLLIILGIFGIIAITDRMSSTSITMPEFTFVLIFPVLGYIGCTIVIISGIIALCWKRNLFLYSFSFFIGFASILGCFFSENGTVFKIVLFILGMSVVIFTTLTILTKKHTAINTSKPWKIAAISSVMTIYLVLILGFGFPRWFDAAARSFPDPVLEQAVRDEIGRPFGFITKSDLARVTHLEVGFGHGQISQLEGIENCTGLEELLLGAHWDLVNITPLANLTHLKILQISNCAINDISPLSTLSQLTHLILNHNEITDVGPLSNLASLSVLQIHYNTIENINPLANLINLTELDLEGNNVTDISALSSLSKLTSLTLNSNPCSDMTALSHLSELRTLFMFSSASNISPLLNNTGLGIGDKIYLGSNQLDNYSTTVVVPELTSRGVSFYHEGWGLNVNLYKVAQDDIQDAVTVYRTSHKMSIPSLSGIYTNADCSNCNVVNISALLVENGDILTEIPDGCYLSNRAGMDNCNNNNSLGCKPTNHYIWLVDNSGTVYSYCTGAGCTTSNSGYQNVWP
jgi:Leucine-rich repeat (LRR) protein